MNPADWESCIPENIAFNAEIYNPIAKQNVVGDYDCKNSVGIIVCAGYDYDGEYANYSAFCSNEYFTQNKTTFRPTFTCIKNCIVTFYTSVHTSSSNNYIYINGVRNAIPVSGFTTNVNINDAIQIAGNSTTTSVSKGSIIIANLIGGV